jgi:hypothetical protein
MLALMLVGELPQCKAVARGPWLPERRLKYSEKYRNHDHLAQTGEDGVTGSEQSARKPATVCCPDARPELAWQLRCTQHSAEWVQIVLVPRPYLSNTMNGESTLLLIGCERSACVSQSLFNVCTCLTVVLTYCCPALLISDCARNAPF